MASNVKTGEMGPKPREFPAQEQEANPGADHKMNPEPDYSNPGYKGSGLLQDKVAIITGGDSGIGRAVAVLYGREGCKGVTIVYHKNDKDAEKTKELVEKEGSKCLLIRGDVTEKSFCEDVVKKTLKEFDSVDILVNHAGIQFRNTELTKLTEKELDITMKTNVYAYFYMAQAVLPHFKKGSSIINTSSINAYRGHADLMDYSATKGANRAFSYSLAANLADKGIRVNAVAPGPIWTPFIPSSFPADQVKTFGQDTPMGRAGQPDEVAPAYVFLASNACSSYITGQTIHVNGGIPADS